MTVRSNGRLTPALYLLLVIILPLLMAGIQATTADQSLVRTESVQLNVGDSLVIRSDHLAIQQVFVEGNLSAAQLTKPNQYPANNFEIQALTSGTYEVKAIFSQATDYNVYLLVEDGGTTAVQNSTSYYISGGTFELDVSAYFNPRPVDISATVPSISPWDSFVDWVGSFGQAFPSWVKALYLILGVQFLAVGGLWIRREAASREGTSTTVGQRRKSLPLARYRLQIPPSFVCRNRGDYGRGTDSTIRAAVHVSGLPGPPLALGSFRRRLCSGSDHHSLPDPLHA